MKTHFDSRNDVFCIEWTMPRQLCLRRIILHIKTMLSLASTNINVNNTITTPIFQRNSRPFPCKNEANSRPLIQNLSIYRTLYADVSFMLLKHSFYSSCFNCYLWSVWICVCVYLYVLWTYLFLMCFLMVLNVYVVYSCGCIW